jgi:putative acetyltransferase
MGIASRVDASSSPRIRIRPFVAADYDAVRALWEGLPGVQLTDPDRPGGVDSAEGIARFLRHNPGLSFVAESRDDGNRPRRIAGALLAGTDGRRGYLHHLAVREDRRGEGIGTALVDAAIAALTESGMEKTHCFVLKDNEDGARFWSRLGWRDREDLMVYSLVHGTDEPHNAAAPAEHTR